MCNRRKHRLNLDKKKENTHTHTHTHIYIYIDEYQEQNVGCKASILKKAMHIQCGKYPQNLQDQRKITKIPLLPKENLDLDLYHHISLPKIN